MGRGTEMAKDTANVPVEIHWYQVLNALEKLAESRDIERLSVHDVERITGAAKVALDRLKEAGKAPEKVKETDLTEEFVDKANGMMTVTEIITAIERGEVTFCGRKLQFADRAKPIHHSPGSINTIVVPSAQPANYTGVTCAYCGAIIQLDTTHYCHFGSIYGAKIVEGPFTSSENGKKLLDNPQF
jgi:hypothetical protein